MLLGYKQRNNPPNDTNTIRGCARHKGGAAARRAQQRHGAPKRKRWRLRGCNNTKPTQERQNAVEDRAKETTAGLRPAAKQQPSRITQKQHSNRHRAGEDRVQETMAAPRCGQHGCVEPERVVARTRESTGKRPDQQVSKWDKTAGVERGGVVAVEGSWIGRAGGSGGAPAAV